MVYALFYKESTGWNGVDFSGPVQLIEYLGSDGVYVLDARKNKENQKNAAASRAKTLKYAKGYKLMRGKSFTDSKPITDLILV